MKTGGPEVPSLNPLPKVKENFRPAFFVGTGSKFLKRRAFHESKRDRPEHGLPLILSIEYQLIFPVCVFY